MSEQPPCIEIALTDAVGMEAMRTVCAGDEMLLADLLGLDIARMSHIAGEYGKDYFILFPDGMAVDGGVIVRVTAVLEGDAVLTMEMTGEQIESIHFSQVYLDAPQDRPVAPPPDNR